MPIIEMENVTKRFRARQGTRVLIGRGGIADWIRGKQVGTKTALDDVSFEIEQGESIGIIGANGSGKSTLLKIIAGVTVPTEGTVRVHGRVASLLELGAGFHPMLTGRENVYLNAGILGMRRRQVKTVFNEIVDFSGIGDFIEYPVATYSSGMYVRLAFSVAAHTNPDVFLIDEVLSVGDEEFQRRCQRRIGELTSEGKTMVFVSHDLGIVNSLCERVLLMSQGEMILRDSTTRAINFYLRQIGEEKGLHTMRSGSLEAIFCNGRVSLFYEQREITAASGLQFQVLNYGQWQSGLDADWDITERTETSCRARGYLAKLKLYFVWEIRLEEGEFFWKAGFECEEHLSVERYEIVLYFPMTLSRWAYDESNGSFPELLPEHTSWHQAIDPDLLCEQAAILPSEGEDTEAVSIYVDDHRPNIRGSWANTDYMTGCRVLKIEEHIGEASEGFAPGHHELLSMRLQVGGDREKLEAMLGERSQKRAIRVEDISARFDRGSIRISRGGVQVTDARHMYTSVQIGHLWNDSTSYRWESFRREGDTIHVEGASRRFPFKQVWEISAVDSGIGIRIWIEAFEDIEIQECHTSVMVVPGYTSWSTKGEEGAFPPITREDHDWTHLNRDYAPGQFVEASGEGLPSIRLENGAAEDIPLSMTVLNSSYFENARVLQGLRSPEHGARLLECGRHLFYDGCMRVK